MVGVFIASLLAATPHVPGEAILELDAAAVSDVLKVDDVEVPIVERFVSRRFPDHAVSRWVRVRFPDTWTWSKALAAIKVTPGVLRVQPNHRYVLQSFAAREPTRVEQWALHNDGSAGLRGPLDARAGSDIGWLEARARLAPMITRDVIVAVLDTGFDLDHPELAGALWVNEAERDGVPGFDDDGNGFTDDIHGWDFRDDDADADTPTGEHGTGVAGVLAASIGDGDVDGVTEHVQVMPLRFVGHETGTTADAVAAMLYAIDNGAEIINASFGQSSDDPLVATILELCEQAGVAVISAAGNAGADLDESPFFPASFGSNAVMTVAASDRRDRALATSSFGRHTVDVAAPGDEITTLANNGAVTVASGTSVAAPYVTGALALTVAATDWSAVDALDVVRESVEPQPAWACRTRTGGRLSLRVLAETLAGDDTMAPQTPELELVEAGGDFAVLAVIAPADDGPLDRATRYDVRVDGEPVCGVWPPAVAGTRQLIAIRPLSPERVHAIELSALDQAGNRSETVHLNVETTALEWSVDEALELGRLELQGEWDTRPDGIEHPASSDALAAASLPVPLDLGDARRAYLAFRLDGELRGGDLLSVEASRDGDLWEEVGRFSGRFDVDETRQVQLSHFAAESSVHLRFVVSTGEASTSAGVAVITPRLAVAWRQVVTLERLAARMPDIAAPAESAVELDRPDVRGGCAGIDPTAFGLFGALLVLRRRRRS